MKGGDHVTRSAIAPVPRAVPRSIAWRIFALVIATFVASTAMLFAVTFSGPPPMPDPQTVPAVAAALLAGKAPAGHAAQIEVAPSPDAPRPMKGEQRQPDVERRLAAALGVSPADVLVLSRRAADGDTGGAADALRDRFQAGWRTGSGWRVVRSTPPALLANWHRATLAAMAVALLALLLPGWWLARAISRPIERLAVAADRVRAGAPLAPLPARGPAEVRTLTRAVTAMHDRLSGHAQQRTTMLAAIAHDLGTPLSRLAFWLEQLPDPAHGRAMADIDEMRAMIADTLAFARDEAGPRCRMRVDLGSLLDSLAEDMRVGGQEVAVVPGPRVVVLGDPRGLRRLFANLIGNATRYGERASVSWSVAGRGIVVLVEDEGPGIDPAMAARLFEPFVRGDPSRNRSTGGTGLGLAIVRSIAVRHGGEATLANRPGRGAVARVTLPADG